jgi:hypothetical protein
VALVAGCLLNVEWGVAAGHLRETVAAVIRGVDAVRKRDRVWVIDWGGLHCE